MSVTFDYGVTNTGTNVSTFYVGASMLTSVSGTGCSIGLAAGGSLLEDAPIKTVTLSPGQTMNLSYCFGDINMSGTFYCVSKVYSNIELTTCLSGCAKAFDYAPDIVLPPDDEELPPIDATYKATIAVSTPYRDVSAYSTVKNTGQVDETLYVGMSVVTVAGGTSCGLYNAGTFIRDLPVKTVTLSPGESVTLEFVMGDLSAYAYTSITAIGKVYSASDLHPYSCLGGDKSSVMLT